ncbi:MAG: hypothetical protein M3R24_25430 [Chloroflexota bacterium]|nr:hypothetical protein [Chloroflexota bacterium]
MTEIKALTRMAMADCRHPREQLRFLFRSEAEKRGLLDSDSDTQKATEEQSNTNNSE